MDVLRLVLASLLSSAVATAQLVDNHNFPLKSPTFATMTMALLHEKVGGEWIDFPFQSERDNVLFYEGQGNFAAMFYQQPHPAPVVYVIPGLGGSEDSGTSNWLAEKLFAQGFHVITLPSPFSWGFSLRGSSSGIVGYMPEDTHDLYLAMTQLEEILLEEYGFQITRRALIGYSLGGLTISHLLNWDASLKKLNFNKAIIINPPVDLRHGIEQVDQHYEIGAGWSRERRESINDRAFELLQELYTKPVEELVEEGIEDKIDLTEPELKFLIGQAFRSSLSNIIFVSQLVNDLGVLRTPIGRSTRQQRKAEAASFNLLEYIEKFLYFNLVNRGETRSQEEIMRNIGLLGHRQILANNPNLFVMHNMDDFLMRPGDAELLMNLMPGRARIYRFGGHVGNLWHADNLNYIYDIFSGLKR